MRYEKVVAIVQARLASRRLPGKVLLPIGRRTMLARVVERVQRIQHVDGLLVATSTEPEDDAIEHACRENGWACHRGSPDDVLDRCFRAAQSVQADHILRIDADQPLLSWQECDRTIDLHLKSGADLTHNLTSRGSNMPHGTGCEVIKTDALDRAHAAAMERSHREHPTEYIHAHPDRFKIVARRAPPELDRPDYRLGVELLDDLERVRRIQRTAGETTCVELQRVIALLDRHHGARGLAM